jgi:hypothetical protein
MLLWTAAVGYGRCSAKSGLSVSEDAWQKIDVAKSFK